MRTKRLIIGIFATALVVAVVLIYIGAYYVAIALMVGALLYSHRELWSLVTKRRLPPFDERVRENVKKSVRNGFVFFVLALALLMLPFSTALVRKPSTVELLGGLLLAGGAVYLVSYIFYDQVETKLREKGLKMLKVFLVVAGVSLAAFIISVFLHNAISSLVGAEEPVFFFISIILAPLGFAVGLIGSLVIFVKGLLTKAP